MILIQYLHMLLRYPSIEPYRADHLKVSSLHSIYWEESGNPQGQPILFLHGGPGSGTEPAHRTFFDPHAYRIILTDQRGCGHSTPHSCLEENTTWHLIDDLEQLRLTLGIDRWIVFGGSWGSTLALTYAVTHPSRVQGLILRGIFLSRKQEIDWFYQQGAHHLFPDFWEEYVGIIPKEERNDLVAAYFRRLTSTDIDVRHRAALAWSRWEAVTLKLHMDPLLVSQFTQNDRADAIARIECHYFMHRSFLPHDAWLLEQIDRIRAIPAIIIHGRYDVICPLDTAWTLHRAWPEATLEIVPNAGHSASEPGITDALIRATHSFAYEHLRS